MRVRQGAVPCIAALFLCAGVFGCAKPIIDSHSPTEAGESIENEAMRYSAAVARSKHSIRNITADEFYNSVENPRLYELDGAIRAGVVPHHLTGAALISGFFELVSKNNTEYGTVIIVAPDHKGDRGDIVVSDLDWDINGGVACDTEIICKLLESGGLGVVVDNGRVEEDHSASVLIPYINHYLPASKVAAILVSRTAGFDKTVDLANLLTKTIAGADRDILLVCSIDFSHYLEPWEALQKNEITIGAIQAGDYYKIHSLPNDYVDSPAALNVFLMYLAEIGAAPTVLDNTEASEFAPYEVFSTGETTSYLVLAGV